MQVLPGSYHHSFPGSLSSSPFDFWCVVYVGVAQCFSWGTGAGYIWLGGRVFRRREAHATTKRAGYASLIYGVHNAMDVVGSGPAK